MQRFTNLRVWEEGHPLAVEVYRLTRDFPTEERFGLIHQLRRAAVSIPANIAEGSKRRSRRDYAHFLNVAEGSVAEVEELLMLSRDVGFAPPPAVEELLEAADHVARMLALLRGKVVSARGREEERLTLNARRTTGREGG